MKTLANPNLLLMALTVVLCFTLSPADAHKQSRDSAWDADLYVGMGTYEMTLSGIAGATYISQRPVLMIIAPDMIGAGGQYLEFTIRHEMFHVLGWFDHPGADADTDECIYMDRSLPMVLPEVLPDPSDFEKRFMRATEGTIWVFLEADDPVLIESTLAAMKWWNEQAGREVFRLRAGPATLR